MIRIFAAILLVALIVGCATARSATPVVVEVRPESYVVGNVTLNTPADLKAYLLQRGIREIQLLLQREVT